MRTGFIFITVFLHATLLWSQSFKSEAHLPPIPEDGFYRIFISSDIAVHLNTSFSNVRIYDSQETEIPYLLQDEAPSYISQEFKEYKILEKRQDPGCCTSLTLHNPDQNVVNSISLVIRNADVTKEAVLLGSDDRQHWFALKQQFILYPAENNSGTSEIKIVDFPLSNYTYYSLRIDDSTSAPLNILSAGYFQGIRNAGKYTEIPLRKILSTDSLKQKKTYLHFQFDTLRIVDKLELSMKGSTYFLRKAFLYQLKERTLKTGTKETYYDLIQEVELNSKHPTHIELPGTKVSDLLLVIENEDNPSLEVGYGKAFQLNRYLTAFLKKEKKYTLKIGDAQLPAPVYDLVFFKDSIPANPPTLTTGETHIFEKGNTAQTFTFFTTKAFIWAAVVLVIVVLGFMSVRLLKDFDSAEKKTLSTLVPFILRPILAQPSSMFQRGIS